MPKFDAGSIETCEYDFTGIRSALTGEFIQDSGVVPEPSRKLVSDTMRLIRASYQDVTGDEIEPTPEAVKSAFEEIEDDDMFERMSEGMLEAMIGFCRGAPTAESLNALPWNRFMAFFGYVMENMLSPEASKPATRQPQRTLKSV